MEGRPPLQALSGRKIRDCQETSHFSIRWGLGPEPKGAATQHQTDFPVHRGDFHRQAAPRPQSSDVLNKEEGQPYQPETETMQKFQGKLLARRPPIYPTPVGGMIPMDPNEQRPLTLSRDTYHWHKNIHQPEKITPDKWRSKIILDNDESMLPAISCSKDSYRDPDKVLKGSLPWRGEKGQLEHRDKYLADARFPAQPYPESKSSTGEPPQTPKQALKPMPPKGPRPDPKKRWHRANALAEEKFETTMAADYKWKACEPRKSLTCPDVMFQLINGDPEAGKKLDKGTTYYHFFGKPTNKDMLSIRSDPQQEEPLCVTIPGQPISCSTASKEHVQWAPARYRKLEPIKSKMQKTHFEFRSPGTGPMTTITEDFYAGRKLESGKKSSQRSKQKQQCQPELSIEELN